MGSAGALISWPHLVEPLGARGRLSQDTYEDFTTVPVLLLPKLTRGDLSSAYTLYRRSQGTRVKHGAVSPYIDAPKGEAAGGDG